MPYEALNYESIEPRTLRKVFMHINGMLADLYSFYKLQPEDQGHNCGSGNFTIPLVLCCLLDSLAVDVWPTGDVISDQERRFKHLIRKRLPYHKGGKWVEQGLAAKVLYLELRNSLVHKAGQDVPTSVRKKLMREAVIGKWDPLPNERREIDSIQAMPAWPSEWPLLALQNKDGREGYAVSGIALYWAVKRLAKSLMEDTDVIAAAAVYHRLHYDQIG